ncbi:hypothetical protein A5634_23120 [Mycobacterium asiaticum]|uniref:Uncharacterized protein n=1 Tax=Mycobacterium asiaticum TaxID=1790 RepID=A0A1A3P156_MYCAS|nr:DUF4878 domain-containing protein [Mycobacterium asiaticum]OBK27405.1 hypothetical protein A5634_23120 [Mycobacterium asiaticum]
MQPGPFGGWPQQQPPPPPPRPKWATPAGKGRKAWWISIAVGGVVVLATVVVAAFGLFGSTGGDASPGDVVRRYLQALAAGDAQAALSYSVQQPTSKQFLTDAVLKQQVAKWPISNISILDDDASARQSGHVHVSATFGAQTSDATLEVTPAAGGWKLKAAAVQLSTVGAAAKTLTIFGKPLDSATYVFPGWVEVGTTNSSVTVSATPPLLDGVSAAKAWPLALSFTLTEQGRSAVRDQLTVALAQCERSHLLAPPGCPLHLNAEDFIEGSASWGPFDVSEVEIGNVEAANLGVSFSGPLRFTVTATTSGGVPKMGLLTRPLAGTADLTQTPPQVSFS